MCDWGRFLAIRSKNRIISDRLLAMATYKVEFATCVPFLSSLHAGIHMEALIHIHPFIHVCVDGSQTVLARAPQTFPFVSVPEHHRYFSNFINRSVMIAAKLVLVEILSFIISCKLY